MMGELLRVNHLHKRFGLTHANNDISLSVSHGEIRSISGENGSGKSTLTSIISGIQSFDEGEMLLEGKPYQPTGPLDADQRGVAMVVQELGVVTNLTGATNIFLGKTDQFRRGFLLDTRAMETAAKAVFTKWELPMVPLNQPCATLSMEQRKIIELARALNSDPVLLILDEITQSLSHDTRNVIYRLRDRFKEENRAMIVISHDIEETAEISDSVTVLRDGKVVDTVASADTTVDQLKQMMVGRKIEGDYVRSDNTPSYEPEVLLKVENLGLADHKVKDVRFELHRGEILAVCGLSDAGIHPLGSAIFGLSYSKRMGSVTDVASGRQLRKPSDMIECGGAYLSKNRDEEGLMLDDSIRNNMYLPSAVALSGKGGYTSPKAVDRLAQEAFDNFDVKAMGIRQTIGRLSGGNKQKINLGRWLGKELRYVILDCPTRGVDVGVKAYIYDLLKKRKAEGVGFLLITDELSEAIGMADRIIVLKNGSQVATIERGPDFVDSKIIEVMI